MVLNFEKAGWMELGISWKLDWWRKLKAGLEVDGFIVNIN